MRLRILLGVLAFGALQNLAIVSVVAHLIELPPDDTLSVYFVACSLGTATIALLLRGRCFGDLGMDVERRAAPSDAAAHVDAARLAVVSSAVFFEAASLVAGCGYLVVRSPWFWLLGGLPILGILSLFPTEARFARLKARFHAHGG